MKRHRPILTRAICSLLVAWLVLPCADAIASGTYRGRPASPPASIDRSAYELGKKVFAGEFTRTANPDAADAQRAALEVLQERLPTRARASVDLPGYAGQLDDDQYRALLYYLSKRFKVEQG